MGGNYGSVIGGFGSVASGDYSIAGGISATASGTDAIALGHNLTVSGSTALAIGDTTTASGSIATAIGFHNSASGDESIALGTYAAATNAGCFVWGDISAGVQTTSTNVNSVTMRAAGGYRFFTKSDLTAGVFLPANGTAWASISDRNSKKDFAPVDSLSILEKLAAMPITKWHYKWENADVTPHIGPMAQDFKAAFYPGTDDKSITTQEADGVTFAAIQGLNQKLEQKETEISELKEEVLALKASVNMLRKASDIPQAEGN